MRKNPHYSPCSTFVAYKQQEQYLCQLCVRVLCMFARCTSRRFCRRYHHFKPPKLSVDCCRRFAIGPLSHSLNSGGLQVQVSSSRWYHWFHLHAYYRKFIPEYFGLDILLSVSLIFVSMSMTFGISV